MPTIPSTPQSPSTDTLATIAFTESANSLYLRGTQYLKKMEYDEAIWSFQQALELDPKHVPSLSDLAWTLLTIGRFPLAYQTYKQARRLAPDNPDILSGIGLCFQAEGNFSKALSYYNKALKINPDEARYLYNIALLEQPHPNTGLGKRLRELYESRNCTGAARVYVCFSLAKIWEKHGDIKHAFQYYAEANRLQHSLAPYDEAAKMAVFDLIEKTFTADFIARLRNTECMDATPIFVLGMPRSGTSLVEQILASHSLVYGAGEIDVIPRVAEKLIPQLAGGQFPRVLQRMDKKAFRLLAEHSLRQFRSYCPDNSPHIVAKTPNNFFLIGLITLLFPRAAIIHCVRNPMDNCWSLFRQHFVGSHPFCYDQGTIGRYYCRYQKLMRHWHNVLPGVIYDVQYETLVSRPEAAIRALIEHCRLPWEDRCLAFYRTKRVVTTASFRQVRRPIYSTSLNAWEPLAQELAPLRAALGV